MVCITSLAVGATTSPWLVPPYLAAMAWLLVAPPARRASDRALNPTVVVAAPPVADPGGLVSEDSATIAEATPGLAEKPKAGRGRGRKPKAKVKPEAPVVEKTAATWVQVAPGKFVRVELPVEPVAEPTVEIDPHSDSQDVGAFAEATTDVEQPPNDPEPTREVAPEPTESQDSWRCSPLLVEDEPIDDPVFVDPPEPARLVAAEGPARPIQPRVRPARSAWVRPDPRPKLRRGNGRVGAVPRVVLHRG